MLIYDNNFHSPGFTMLLTINSSFRLFRTVISTTNALKFAHIFSRCTSKTFIRTFIVIRIVQLSLGVFTIRSRVILVGVDQLWSFISLLQTFFRLHRSTPTVNYFSFPLIHIQIDISFNVFKVSITSYTVQWMTTETKNSLHVWLVSWYDVYLHCKWRNNTPAYSQLITFFPYKHRCALNV